MSERISAEGIITKVKEMAQPLADQLGLELVDVEYKVGGNFLRVFIDRPGKGVSMDDCGNMSRRLSAELDVCDPIDHAYNLEVSSPGLDRPLRNEADYLRYLGKLAKVVLNQPVNGQYTFVGRIGEVQNGMVRVGLGDRESVWLPLGQVKRASLEVEMQRPDKHKPSLPVREKAQGKNNQDHIYTKE